MYNFYALPVRVEESTLIHTGKGVLMSVLIAVDGVNDPTVAIHDDTDGDTAANEIVPSTTYDAELLTANGVVFKYPKLFTTGLYVKIANIGSGSVVIDYRTSGSLHPKGFK